MNALETKFSLSTAAFRRRLTETIAWCSSQNLIVCPEEDANAIQRRDMSRRAAEFLSLAYRTDPSLFEQRSWISRLMDSSRIRRARKMKAEAEGLLAIADPGSIDQSVPIGIGGPVLTMLKDDAEKNIKTWTFGCVGCPPSTPFEHTIKFKYVQDDHLPDREIRTLMDLPDQVTMSAGPVPIEPEATSTKGSH